MADYSEFPTTPTAWQRSYYSDGFRQVTPTETEEPPPPARRGVDVVALIPGLLFTALAIVVLAGVDIPLAIFRGGGLLWVLLIGAGVALLVHELRKRRHR